MNNNDVKLMNIKMTLFLWHIFTKQNQIVLKKTNTKTSKSNMPILRKQCGQRVPGTSDQEITRLPCQATRYHGNKLLQKASDL